MNNIEKEKSYIDNILQKQEYNGIDRAKAGILSILKGSIQKGKITQEQYDELTMYLEQKIEQIKTQNETRKNFSLQKNSQNTNSQNTNSQNTNSQNINSQNINSQNINSQNTTSLNNNVKKQFQEKLKVEPKELKYIPIYKGKFNSIPQKNKGTKER